MKRTIASHSFFIEMILVLLFTGISAACAIQLFAGAHTTSQTSAQLNSAMLAAQTSTETALSAQTPTELEQLFVGDEIESTVDSVAVIQGFDQNWQPTDQSPTYSVRTNALFHTNDPGTMVTVQVTVFPTTEPESTEIFYLTGSRYFPADGPATSEVT